MSREIKDMMNTNVERMEYFLQQLNDTEQVEELTKLILRLNNRKDHLNFKLIGRDQ